MIKNYIFIKKCIFILQFKIKWCKYYFRYNKKLIIKKQGEPIITKWLYLESRGAARCFDKKGDLTQNIDGEGRMNTGGVHSLFY